MRRIPLLGRYTGFKASKVCIHISMGLRSVCGVVWMCQVAKIDVFIFFRVGGNEIVD